MMETTSLGTRFCHDSDPCTSIFIPLGGRYPLILCIALDFLCCHYIANDGGCFVLCKWGTRNWCDDSNRHEFGMYGYNVTQNINSSMDVRSAVLDNNEGGDKQLVSKIGDFMSDDMADNGVTDNHKEGSVEDIYDTTKANDTLNVATTVNDNVKGEHTPVNSTTN